MERITADMTTQANQSKPTPTPTERAREKVEAAKFKLTQAKNALELAENRNKSRSRQEDTRRKIIIGGIIMKLFIKEKRYSINALQSMIKENVDQKDLHLFHEILSMDS